MDSIKKIETLSNRWNFSLVKIGEILDEVAHQIDEALPEELGDVQFKAYGITFWRRGKSSSVGSLGPSFYVDNELVSTTREPGSSFYLHGDFNALVRVASRKARREAARNFPRFLEEFVKFLEEQVNDTEGAEVLLHMVLGK